MRIRASVIFVSLAAGLAAVGSLQADRLADIARTKHNLSVSGPGQTRATGETEVCVFCHTPHGASASPGAPLWNRQMQGQSYTVYESASLDAQTIAGALKPNASSTAR